MPLIIDWPGVTKADTVCDTPVISMDLFPTFMEIAGITRWSKDSSANARWREPCADAKANRGDLKRDELFWHYPHYQHYQKGGATPYSAIRKGDFKLIEFLADKNVRALQPEGRHRRAA